MTEKRQVTITLSASTLQGIHYVFKEKVRQRKELSWLNECLKELEDAMLKAAATDELAQRVEDNE